MFHRRLNINTKALIRIIGFLLIVESVFMLIPTIVAFSKGGSDADGFLISCCATLIVGLILAISVRPTIREFGKRDGILLTSLMWVVFSLFGMLPFMLGPLHLSLAAAFFEAMSGFSTTGASTINDIAELPHATHLWRCMMQWIGGVGIIIFTVALLPVLNSSGGVQMFNAEATGVTHDKIRPRVSSTAKRLWLVYCILTALLCLILWLGPMDIFNAVCHSFTTVSAGGISTTPESIGAWEHLSVRIPIILFMFLSGVSFFMIYRASIGKVRQVWCDANFRTYLLIVVFASIYVAIVTAIDGERGFANLVVNPIFQVVSAISTTGYTINDINSWNDLIFPILVPLMFMGACAGSTSGGVKIDRIVFMWKNAANEFKKIIHPNRFYPLTINGVAKPPELTSKVTAFFAFYIIIMLFSGLAIAMMGVSLEDAYFATFACLSNSGLGIGEFADSYHAVPAMGKLILSFCMLVGRLEIFTVIILLSRSFWHR